MDWGLLELKSGDNKFLREETVYSSNVSAPRIVNFNSELFLIYFDFIFAVDLLLWNGRRFSAAIRLDPIDESRQSWLCRR